jgi:hypothetical protein
MEMQKKNIIRPLIASLLVLIIPFLGNIYIEGWNWQWNDFLFGFSFIFILGLLLEYTNKKITKPLYKIVACAGIFLIFAAIWVMLATG